MKNKRLFSIITTLNVGLWIVFIVNRIRNYYGAYENGSDLILVLGILALIVFSFSFFCYKLTKTYRAVLPLSDSSRLIGPVIVILFTLLTMIMLWLSIKQFKGYFIDRFPDYDRWLFINLVILTLSLSSTYLCIAYWIIRKEIKTQLTSLITDLGKEENS